MSALLPASSIAYAREYPKRKWASKMGLGKVPGGEGMELFAREGQPDLNNVPARNAYHNTRGPNSAGYTLNPDLWCEEIRPLLSCVVVTKDRGFSGTVAGQQWGHRTGGIAITKRHVLYCAHAHDLAANTWGLRLSGAAPTVLRFIDINGNTVDRVQIHQANGYPSDSHNGVEIAPNLHIGNDFGEVYTDLCVAVLDEDLPDTVLLPLIAPCNRPYEFNDYEAVGFNQEWMAGNALGYSYLRFTGSTGSITYKPVQPKELGDGITITHVIEVRSQIAVEVSGRNITVRFNSSHTFRQVFNAVNASTQARALVTPLAPYGADTVAVAGTAITLWTNTTNYQSLPFSMFHVLNGAYDTFHYGSLRNNPYQYDVYTGDSGTPRAILYRGHLVSTGLIGGEGTHQYPLVSGETFAERVNLMIQAADGFAIAMGRLEEPTGYTVRVAHDWLWDTPLVNSLGKVITLNNGTSVPIFNSLPS